VKETGNASPGFYKISGEKNQPIPASGERVPTVTEDDENVGKKSSTMEIRVKDTLKGRETFRKKKNYVLTS